MSIVGDIHRSIVDFRCPPPSSIMTETKAELMARTSTSDMFSRRDKCRVRVGMHEDKEAGETLFGTWIEDID